MKKVVPGPVDVVAAIDIRRPREVVATYMFDPANDVAWTTGVVEAQPLMGGRHRVGSRVRRKARFMGREFWYEYRVVDAEGDHRVEMVVDHPFPMHIAYVLTEVDGGTRATIRTTGEPGGFFRLAAPLLAPFVRRNIRNDLKVLRSILESSAS